MNIEESKIQLNELVKAWELNEACLNQTDINAITKILKELTLKDDEYNILKVTSEQIEEEQRREIYELELTIKNALELIKSSMSIQNEKVLNDISRTLKREDDEIVEEEE